MPIFGPKCQFLAKFGRFWAQNPIFWGQGVKILVPSYRDSNETPFSCWKHWSARLQLAARGENVLFRPQNLDIWGQKSIFCFGIMIFSTGHITSTPRATTFPFGPTRKNFRFRVLGNFPGLWAPGSSRSIERHWWGTDCSESLRLSNKCQKLYQLL